MGLRVPPNQIISKYTSGEEYMFTTTQNVYKGYYYEINGKTFAGKEFNPLNPEIVKIKSNNYNKLLGKASTYIYGTVSGTKIPTNVIPVSLPTISNSSSINTETKFYCKKTNQQPIVIKEINEATYKSLQNNPIYQTTFIGTYQDKIQTLDEAEKQMPGIKAFLGL